MVQNDLRVGHNIFCFIEISDQVQLAVSRLHWWGKQYGKFVFMVTTWANRVKSHLAPSA